MNATDHRTSLINGLLDLAAFLEANPDVPAPYSLNAHHFPKNATDDEMRADIDHVASLLGTEPCEEAGYGHYKACLTFGPVQYKAVAILSAARARHQADSSYDGCIDPT
ncbi:hypothetical protein [Nonomuraea endophytica]|uniref:hypothetical protein n=1 Tax=Nonomuraea endophytica TaxID=714136 RepID=UPI0037C98BBC